MVIPVVIRLLPFINARFINHWACAKSQAEEIALNQDCENIWYMHVVSRLPSYLLLFLISYTVFVGVFSSPEHGVLIVSYCGQSMSVVRRPSCIVRRAASTIALKAYPSYTPGPIDSILDRKH